MMVLLEDEFSLNGGDNHRLWDTHPLLAVLKKYSHFLHSQAVGVQKLWM